MAGINFQDLLPLVGIWQGQGQATLPGGGDYSFKETTRVKVDSARQLLWYEQQIWLLPDDKPGHTELGFVRLTEDGKALLHSVHSSGRLESLRAEASWEDKLLVLAWQSTVLAGDPQMLRSARQWSLAAGQWRYSNYMATSQLPQLTEYLRARLRSSD